MTRNAATLWGFVAAPFSAGVASIVVAFVVGGYPDNPMDLLGAFVTAFFFSIFPMVLLAIPMYSLLNRKGLINLWTVVISGALIGAVFGVVLRLPNAPRAGDVLVMAAIGASAAVGFWLVWRTGQTLET